MKPVKSDLLLFDHLMIAGKVINDFSFSVVLPVNQKLLKSGYKFIPKKSMLKKNFSKK
jgi:hypothetical protein